LLRAFVCNTLACSVQQTADTRVGYRFFDGETTKSSSAVHEKQCPLVKLDTHNASRLLADVDSQLTVAPGGAAGLAGSAQGQLRASRLSVRTFFLHGCSALHLLHSFLLAQFQFGHSTLGQGQSPDRRSMLGGGPRARALPPAPTQSGTAANRLNPPGGVGPPLPPISPGLGLAFSPYMGGAIVFYQC